MVTGRQPPVKATCFAGGYSLLFQIVWLRVSQGQIDGLLTLEMFNLLLQFADFIKIFNRKWTVIKTAHNVPLFSTEFLPLPLRRLFPLRFPK